MGITELFKHAAYFLNSYGMPLGSCYASIIGLGGGWLFCMYHKFKKEAEESKEDELREKVQQVELKKRLLECEDWNIEAARESMIIKKEYEALQEQKRLEELENNKLIEVKAEKLNYKGIKVVNKKALLLGYDKNYEPVWGLETNYIIAGTTRQGKTRKLHALLLNFLANKQGVVYLIDLKGTDYILYDGIPNIMCRVTDINKVCEAVKAFREEYERRIEIIREGYIDSEGKKRPYLDIEDYNRLNPKKPLRDFMLLIDEFADISDRYTQKGVPIGCYAEIIEMARKCAAMGGRVVMGTQRPSRDVIIGTLKNNTALIGLACLNETNSKIVIDVAGCERLAKTEALGYIDTKLTKIFAYNIDNEYLIKYTDQLK